MKWFIIVGLVVGLITVLPLAGTSEGSVHGKNPFIGAWESTDFDGSHQRIAIGGGPANHHHLAYFDDDATACGGGQAIALGVGESVENQLWAGGLLMRCLQTHTVDTVTPAMFIYNADDDTLTQAYPMPHGTLTWHRIGHNNH